jgi:biuret amidohydrolase
MAYELAVKEDYSYRFSPETTALIVIDMQRDFLSSEGGGTGQNDEDFEAGPAIVPNVKAVLGAARAAGLHIVHTREGHPPDLSTLHDMRRLSSRRVGAEIGAAGPLGRNLVRGEHGHDFIDELQPVDGEVVIDKPGFSAFFKTDLEKILREKGVTHTIVCGVTTECCVQSSIRSAIDLGFFVLTLEDCCASYYKDMHDATMRMLPAQGGLFGFVGNSKDVVAALSAGGASNAAE